MQITSNQQVHKQLIQQATCRNLAAIVFANTILYHDYNTIMRYMLQTSRLYGKQSINQ